MPWSMIMPRSGVIARSVGSNITYKRRKPMSNKVETNKVEVTLSDGTKHVVDSVSVKPYKEPVQWEYLAFLNRDKDDSLKRRKVGTTQKDAIWDGYFGVLHHRSSPEAAIMARISHASTIYTYSQLKEDIPKWDSVIAKWKIEDATD